jgi:hypothetical protein
MLSGMVWYCEFGWKSSSKQIKSSWVVAVLWKYEYLFELLLSTCNMALCGYL